MLYYVITNFPVPLLTFLHRACVQWNTHPWISTFGKSSRSTIQMAFSKSIVTLFKAGFGISSSTLFRTYNRKNKPIYLLLFFVLERSEWFHLALEMNPWNLFHWYSKSNLLKYKQNISRNTYCTIVLLLFARHEGEHQRHLLCMVVFPYERVDGQQLREGMTDEFEGPIDIPRFGPAQVNQLLGCSKHKVAATVDVHVFFQEGLG